MCTKRTYQEQGAKIVQAAAGLLSGIIADVHKRSAEVSEVAARIVAQSSFDLTWLCYTLASQMMLRCDTRCRALQIEADRLPANGDEHQDLKAKAKAMDEQVAVMKKDAQFMKGRIELQSVFEASALPEDSSEITRDTILQYKPKGKIGWEDLVAAKLGVSHLVTMEASAKEVMETLVTGWMSASEDTNPEALRSAMLRHYHIPPHGLENVLRNEKTSFGEAGMRAIKLRDEYGVPEWLVNDTRTSKTLMDVVRRWARTLHQVAECLENGWPGRMMPKEEFDVITGEDVRKRIKSLASPYAMESEEEL
jgi:hypothetical protein